jgi:hypothetical protein
LAREYFADGTQAEEWTRQSIREQYGIEMQANAAELNSEVARQQGLAIGAQIQQDAADRKLQIWQQREDMRMKRAAAAQRKQPGPNWGGLTRPQLEQLSAQGILPADGQVVLDRLRSADPKAEKAPDTRAQIPGYEQTQDVAPGDASIAKKTVSAARSLRADLARMAEIRAKNNGGTVWNREDVNEARTIIGGMSPKYSQMYGAGAPSKTELELFMENLVDPTDYQWPLVGVDPMELYSRAADHISRVEQEQVSAYGYRPAGAAQGRDTSSSQRADDPMRSLKGAFGFRRPGGQ